MSGLLTNGGLNLVLDGISSRANTVISQFKVGSGTNAPLLSDTDLQTPVALTGITYFGPFSVGYPVLDTGGKTITIRCVVSSTQANGATLAEFGIFNSDGSPVLYSHDTFTAIAKNNQVEIIFEQIDSAS